MDSSYKLLKREDIDFKYKEILAKVGTLFKHKTRSWLIKTELHLFFCFKDSLNIENLLKRKYKI